MKKLLIAAALALPLVAGAQPTPTGSAEPGFHARLYERYCAKLRESPEAYVQFVRRMQPVYGITYADFAPENKGDPVLADCGVAPGRVAEVRRRLASAKR